MTSLARARLDAAATGSTPSPGSLSALVVRQRARAQKFAAKLVADCKRPIRFYASSFAAATM
jgi:hypothetical protein